MPTSCDGAARFFEHLYTAGPGGYVVHGNYTDCTNYSPDQLPTAITVILESCQQQNYDVNHDLDCNHYNHSSS